MICIDKTKKENCCGCTACASICPRHAINMVPDEEGFLYPEVNDQCVNCGLCIKTCPVQKTKPERNKPFGYIVRNKNTDIVKDSTSGGAFTAFAYEVFQHGGVVFGAGYNENMRVVCKKATCPEELKEMRGSKFVQSDLGNAFQEVKHLLQSGTTVLFSGTPCQIEGLLSFLGKKPDHLLCVDFVCRGVPSPGLWDNYLHMMQKKFGAKIVGARFKNKTYGYHATTMKLDFANGNTYYGSGRIDPMMKAFVEELASRPSCYACAFKTADRNSDITMFDCYNFTRIMNKQDDNKGYTSLLIHSEKGREFFSKVEDQMQVYPCDSEMLIQENGIMVRNSAKPNEKRNAFYLLVAHDSIDVAIQKVSPITCADHVMEYGKRFFFRTGLIVAIKRVRNWAKMCVRRKK